MPIQEGLWHGSFGWADMEARVLRWRAALASQAFPIGARIGVLVPNSVEHVCMDQAALASGFVPVPLWLSASVGALIWPLLSF